MDVLRVAQQVHAQLCEAVAIPGFMVIDTDPEDHELLLPQLRQVKDLLDRMDNTAVPLVTVQRFFRLFLRTTIPQVMENITRSIFSQHSFRGSVCQADADELFHRNSTPRVVTTPAFRAYRRLCRCWHRVLLLWDMLRSSPIAMVATDAETMEGLSDEYYHVTFVESACGVLGFLLHERERERQEEPGDVPVVTRFFRLPIYPLCPAWETVVAELA